MTSLKTCPDPFNKSRLDILIAAAVFLVAFILFSWRILDLWDGGEHQFDKYPNAAIQYLNGSISPERILDFSPLYLGLHIGAYKLMDDPMRSILWLHIALLSATTALLYLLLSRYFGRSLSILGSAAFIFGKSIVVYGYVFEPEPLMLLLLTAVAFFGSRNDLKSNFVTGLSMALCLITRPSFAPLVFIIPMYFLSQRHKGKKFMLSIALFLMPVMLTVIFISIRNHHLQGSFSPLVMSPGTVFYDGNNPLSEGAAVYPPIVNDMAVISQGESDYQHAIYRDIARRVTGKQLGISDTNGYWASKALNFIGDHPGHFILLTIRRIFHIFHGYPWHDLDVAWSAESALTAMKTPYLPFAALSAAALTGLIISIKSWRLFFLPYAIFFNQTLLMALTYAHDRQRVSLYPIFIFFAIAGLRGLNGEGRKKYFLAACIILLAPAFFFETSLMRDDRYIWEGYLKIPAITAEVVRDRDSFDYAEAKAKAAEALALGTWLMESGRPAFLPVGSKELAETASGQLLRLRSDSPSRRFDLALLLMEAERYDEAEEILNSLADKGYDFIYMEGRLNEPFYHLGRIAIIRDDRLKAERMLLRALDRSPGNPHILAQLACLTADNRFTDRLFRYYDDIDAYFLLGGACLEAGLAERASEYLYRMASLKPDYAKGLIYLAAALSAAGKSGEAAEIYLGAAGERPGAVTHENLILKAFEQEAGRGTPEALYRQGIVLKQFGRFQDALAAFSKAAKAGSTKASVEIPNLRQITGNTR